jgi:hypothetical protein
MLLALGNVADFEAAHDLTDYAWKELGDVNGDGLVNVADETALLAALAGNGGGSLNGVPEPSAWELALLAVPMSIFAIRRIRQARG